MPLMSKPSQEAKIAILFVTVGALILVWSGVWFMYQRAHGAEAWEYYVCYGSIGSGLVLFIIGLGLGRIARAARQAEVPPHEVVAAESRISQEAASRAPIVTPTGFGGAAVTGPAGVPQGINPAANAAVNPLAPVATAVSPNPSNPPNPPVNANGSRSATF